MRTLLLAALAFTTLTTATVPAQAAPHVMLNCPADARGVVTHTGEAGWTATNQSSRVQDFRLETIGGQVSLVCTYLIFGTEYWIHRRPPAEFPNCRRSSNSVGFYCSI